jgi:glucose-6-phosphate isomerase
MSADYSLPELTLHLDKYSGAFERALQKAKEDNLVERVWARDHTLWNPKPDEIANRLGWLDVATRMRSEIAELENFAKEVKDLGDTDVLLLGMGGSSLGPDLFSKVFGKENMLRLHVLDSTDPDAVRGFSEQVDPRKTLYIVSSKSGGTVETISFFKYFYKQVKEAAGERGVPGSHFIAITDPGSGLAEIAAKYSFRKTFLADPEIGGRYSALSHFGLVPAALVGVDLNHLIKSAEMMAGRCEQDLATNSGALLGLALGSLALQGRDKATFELDEKFLPFGDWAEQLIAESTGKEGEGILPVVGEPATTEKFSAEDRVLVDFGNEQRQGPRIHINLTDPYDLGGQFFLWEFATAIAGYVLEINPFDQPNVESAKVQGRKFIEEYTKTGKLPKGEISSLDSGKLRKFLNQARSGDYIALQAYAPPSLKLDELFAKLRGELLKKYKVATTFGYGPRFLHSTGQLHKGDRGNGLFVQFITTPPTNDVPIPKEAGSTESEMTFGVLKVAQAMGDAQALLDAGRRVISFEIDGDLAVAIQKLLD